jgi:tetratricopeptide (TPR) repeat protein
MFVFKQEGGAFMKNKIHFSRKLLLTAFVLASMFLIVGISSVYSQEKNPNPCTLGDLYLQAGQLDKAEETYAAILTNNPQEACAIEGMQAVSSQRKALLDEYMKAGDYTKARELAAILLAQPIIDQTVVADYHTMMTQIALTPEAENTSTPTPDTYSVVERYFKLGRPDLAYAHLQTAVVEDPALFSVTPVPNQSTTAAANLPKAKDFFAKSWPAWLLETLKAYLSPLLIILASAGVLYLLIRICVQLYLNHKEIKFDVGDFCTKEGKESGLAVNVKALIEREIFRFEKSPNKNRGHIDQPLANTDISSETTIISKDVSTLFNLLNKVFPPKVATLTGVLHPSSINGCALTLRITGPKGNIVDMCTLKQSDYDPEFNGSQKSDVMQEEALCDYNKLIKPAAFWTFWHITNNYNDDLSYHRKTLTRTFGTCDLYAGILNYTGAGMIGENDAWAKKQIDASLKRDNSNLQAIFNQAQLEISEISEENEKLLSKYSNQWIPSITPDTSDWEIGKKTLLLSYNPVINKLIKIVSTLREFESRKDYETSFLYIFSLYHLGAVFEYLYTFTRMEERLKWDDHDLLDNYQFYDEKIKNNEKKEKPDFTLLELSNYFFSEASKRVVIRKIPPKDNKLIIPRLIVKTKNVSLENALMIKVAELSKKHFTKMKKIKMISETESSASDPSEEGFYSPYNSACFHSLIIGKVLGENGGTDVLDFHKNQAIKHLKDNDIENLFDDPWASKDPSLYPLRFYLKKNEKHSQLTKPISHKIEVIYGLPRQFEIKLEDIIGTEKTDELFEIGASVAGRQYIHEKTGIPLDLIKNWIGQADLLQLPKMSSRLAWLLINIGVISIKEMRKIDDYIILRKLEKTNDEYKLIDGLPDRKILMQWKEIANRLPAIFEPD